MKRSPFNLLLLCVCAFPLTAPLNGWSQAQPDETLLYFMRHGEDTIALREPGQSGRILLRDCKPYLNGEGQVELCCLEVLNPLGEARAELLAQWFAQQDVLPTLTHVFSTYKRRTLQTVLPTAQAAGLDDPGTDNDKNPGDGVQQIPPFVEECQRGFESPTSSLRRMVVELAWIPTEGTGPNIFGCPKARGVKYCG